VVGSSLVTLASAFHREALHWAAYVHNRIALMVAARLPRGTLMAAVFVGATGLRPSRIRLYLSTELLEDLFPLWECSYEKEQPLISRPKVAEVNAGQCFLCGAAPPSNHGHCSYCSKQHDPHPR